ncbi:MAG: 16S rRNA (cytosine(1402)-N(4))-methyltransferase RsmH [Ruminococcus sp.]|uniref:16S rRNA (cytosine(1402)-N(4))-methyltransferase RsmH n=1 Tax=Ruminococcus sp. TaxID=41978 RepID=UPI00292CAD28|nr:16S rRNA (cytosine(1402)-N(4))-methyltransferase RsmH [uncultured Ruminococcus sp.]MBQ1899002.1 16S rRNA (cytosine(1402)-N(4))-methyltransferase RsmH [Ruminococcus sp.]MBQ4238490.1 16S rRNA (cytosine(1402)-N(4))-methyltransferase RsmH [Ruminococcus sp.]
MEFTHVSVLLYEAVDGLNIRPDGIYIDGTAGGGGHSAEILSRLTSGRLYSIDQDPDAIATVTERFKDDDRSTILQGNFGDMKALLNDVGVYAVDGVLLDIGVSSHQLDDGSRGFSYHEDAPLDMRMSQSGETAADLVNTLDVGELSRIISLYGEEKYAFSIAKGIVRAREIKPIETTLELAEIVKENVPQKVRRDGHPARKTFQALRIAVNHELDVLESGLQGAFELLSQGGRLSVITFHSLEDRIVKQFMRDKAQGCTCPKDFPVCVCGNKPKVKIITRKPILPSDEELERNPRARSAKLRVCEKL